MVEFGDNSFQNNQFIGTKLNKPTAPKPQAHIVADAEIKKETPQSKDSFEKSDSKESQAPKKGLFKRLK